MVAYNPFLAEKVKKNEIFSRYPLDFFPENSIIGFTLERVPQNGPDETEARETSGKIEGIGDMLSDGPRRFLGSLFTENRTDYLKINEEFDPGSERTLVACLIHASRARQQCRAANG